MSDKSPEPRDLKRLGAQLEEARRRDKAKNTIAPPTAMGIAFRFTTEMVSALLVGGAFGWALDWAIARWTPFHTRPVLLIVFFVLGAAAGIRNVMSAAKELNEQAAAAQRAAPAANEDDEES